MVTNGLQAFPAAGVDIHVDVDEAQAHGISPGDPAVVEATVRPYTVEEWLAEGSARTFASEQEEIEFFARCPVPGAAPGPQRALAPAPAATPTAEPERITWRPRGVVTPAPEPAPAHATPQTDRISWRAGGAVAA